ncbi:hypothetical protein IMF23_02195 [Chelatococcus daeguensis]|uniref:Mth938-like domain-containing protein n=2 Tax=Chelatococcus TaxID=28209 RepID=A0AAC9JSR5_9HYPH|nr:MULTISPECIES: MTH938/NDUFAF3 family protein [Chelatococcus]APF37674.1 hypothetical protein BOQ54_10325 [Chelatococcus daeguensis]KZE36627.1 hypothetical protein AVW15_00475 [Chelatococcus daeguensis]MBM3082239.1 hypothetical protein [Chelatococcus daeguensis]CUA85793.1 Uncharacterized conserved protein, contains Mth938-like domain [Chelatococcus sambhunathii]
MAERRYEGFVPGRHQIDAYGNGGFRFADMSHKGSVLALPSGVKAWEATSGQGLAPADFLAVRAEADDIELLIVGTGVELVPLSEAVRWHLRELRIAVEVMPTGAAARTYNVLVAEGRKVAAALVAVA